MGRGGHVKSVQVRTGGGGLTLMCMYAVRLSLRLCFLKIHYFFAKKQKKKTNLTVAGSNPPIGHLGDLSMLITSGYRWRKLARSHAFVHFHQFYINSWLNDGN